MHGPIWIRPLTPRDHADVFHVWSDLPREERAGLTPADICLRVGAANYPGWAATASRRASFAGHPFGTPYETVVGFVFVERRPRRLRVFALAVHPDYRRRGAGRGLLSRAAWLALGRPEVRVVATVDETNRPMCECLKSCGFASMLIRDRTGEARDRILFARREEAVDGPRTGDGGSDVESIDEAPGRRSRGILGHDTGSRRIVLGLDDCDEG
jgi:ribosomal protein S18 acetylase RimI-like enzyme